MRAFNKKKKPKHAISKRYKFYDLNEGVITYGVLEMSAKREGYVISIDRTCSFKYASLKWWRDYYEDFPRMKFENQKLYNDRYYKELYKDLFL